MEEEVKQINVKLPLDLAAMLDEMVTEDDSDQSKFIRKLIRQEFNRRKQLPLFPTNEPKRKTNTKGRPVAVAA